MRTVVFIFIAALIGGMLGQILGAAGMLVALPVGVALGVLSVRIGDRW